MTLNKLVYINNNELIIKDNDDILIKELNTKILNNGRIVNRILFIKILNKNIKYNVLKSIINNYKIILIYNEYISNNDIKEIVACLNELGIYKFKLISDNKLINIKNDECIILYNNPYIRIYYYDIYKVLKHIIINTRDYSLLEIKFIIINRLKNKIIYINGHNNNLEKILNNLNLKYFVYNDKYFLINKFALNA